MPDSARFPGRTPVLLRRAVALLALAPAWPARLCAHPGAAPEPHDLWSAWSWEPGVLLSLYLGAWLYTRGVEALWRRAGTGRGVGTAQVAVFAAAAGALAVALVSPVDAVAEALFSVHMVQHLLLMAVAAPLLVLAAPQVAFARGAPARLVRGWRRLGRTRGALAWLARPAPALVLHSAALWAWHVPGAYDGALRSEPLHLLEHGSFFLTALLFWWAVLQPGRHRRREHGPALALLFLMAMQGGLLGALLTFSGSPWFGAHLDTAPAWGLSPLEDQQLAGVVMWVPGGLAYLAAFLWLFHHWLRVAGARAAAADLRAARGSSRPAGA